MPQALKPEIQTQLHAAHLGVDTTKQWACILVSCQSMNGDIKQYVWNCRYFAKNMPYRQKEALINHSVPPLT